MMNRFLVAALLACCSLAHAQLPAERQQLRDIFQQLVAIDTTDSAGSCKLIEENGVFYGRGVVDDKAMAAALVVTERIRAGKLGL